MPSGLQRSFPGTGEMTWPAPASAPKIDVQETREQPSSLGCLCGEGRRSSLSAGWSSRLTEANPLQGRRLTTLLRHPQHRASDPVAPPPTRRQS